MTLATTVALAAVLGPVIVAKTLAAVDRLSGGRVLSAIGPGSSPADYRSAGIDFAERWARLDEAVRVLRVLWGRDPEPFVGRYYSTETMELWPRPLQSGGPPIRIGSWGSDAGLRRVAHLGDGWLASAYNTTPELFADAWARLASHLSEQGKDPTSFANGLATMWFYVIEDRKEADRIFRQRLAPAVHRPEDVLRERLPVGPAAAFAEKLTAFRNAGVQSVMIWPLANECRQLEAFCENVLPAIA
jgi:alkanesulfonate monooxygenase SsuD/methylene tetrahydromethanopterin reductase-like flavin-dependent oxidoreductase (luciferase family)